MSILLIIVIIVFKHMLDRNVIDGLLTVASYTYGPLLGLFAFGIFTKHPINDKFVWLVALVAIGLTTLTANAPTLYAYLQENLLSDCSGSNWECAAAYAKANYYVFGYELLLINGITTFLGLFLIRFEQQAS